MPFEIAILILFLIVLLAAVGIRKIHLHYTSELDAKLLEIDNLES